MAESKAEKQKQDSARRGDSSPLAVPGDDLQGERGEAPIENQMGALVASPTGPVPLSAITNDAERAEEYREARKEKLEKERSHPRAGELLDEETVRGMNAAERRAVARQRGYQVPGRRISVERFMALQDEDEHLDTPERSSRKGRKKA